MATLILTAVGTAVGGPLGGAIGALIGQQADAAIFAPKARHGPRLGELAVQTSSYGSAIPKIFGTMRAAGTVIWATDLQEHRSSEGGGKGRPKTVSYSYSASFAVALSGRPIRTVRRIWADGKLLKGEGGDFKSATKYRLYTGGEDQPADPLIAAAEGIGQAPAFRGIAYAMFEDFELADYGNRIPSLTFEIVADDGPVTVGSIAEQLSKGALAAGETPELGGYAAGGDSVRGALEALADVAPLSLTDEGERLRIGSGASEPVEISEADEGARAGRNGGSTQIVRGALDKVADEVGIAYHDSGRDYQTGLQRARSGLGAGRAERLGLPAVLSAGAAKAMAERRLAALLAGRMTGEVHLPPRCLSFAPGTYVRLPGEAGLWRVQRRSIGEAALVSLDLVRTASGSLAGEAQADPGRPVPNPDLLHGPTTLFLFDLPLDPEPLAQRLRLLSVAAGAQAGWRRAALTASYDGGTSWAEAGGTSAAAVMGHAATALDAAGSALIDTRNSVEVALLNEEMWLEGRTDEALGNGANLAVLGEELIQFGRVEALGAGRFRLSRLLRGRRGSEWAAATHRTGEPFALVETDKIVAIEPPAGLLGGEARLLAHGIGDEEAALASCTMTGEALRPPAPVHLRAVRLAGGDIRIEWVRRSRSGWSWQSGSDTTLGEERELYRIDLSGEDFSRSLTLAEPDYVHTAADQASDGLAGTLHVEVVQIGTIASSRPASMNFSVEN